MSKIYSIAIDGASGVGKSTVARALSERLGILYLDTGAMYRTVGLYMLRNGIDPTDGNAVAAALPDVKLSVRYRDGGQRTYLGEEDVSDVIREQAVGQASSDVSKVQAVRESLVAHQRAIAEGQSLVMDGRDIGTHVLPDATLKVFLIADANIRAKRRVAELREKGLPADESDVLEKLNARDFQDMNRDQSPLRKAPDAHEVNTDDLTREQVVEAIVGLLSMKLEGEGR